MPLLLEEATKIGGAETVLNNVRVLSLLLLLEGANKLDGAGAVLDTVKVLSLPLLMGKSQVGTALVMKGSHLCLCYDT